jgi:hypothetical protein
MSAGHIDWHVDERTGIEVCVIEDDASRKIQDYQKRYKRMPRRS